MNYNAKHTIAEDNPNDYSKVEFPKIELESSKFADTITLLQDGNVITLSSMQIRALREELANILD